MTLVQPLFSVGPRSRASALLLAAGLVMATAATTLVSVVPLYADAIAEAGFRSTLADAEPAARGYEVSMRTTTDEAADAVAAVESAARSALPGELRTMAIVETDSFGMPEGRFADDIITSVATIETDEALFTVAGGSYDTVPTGGALGVSLHTDAAALLDLDVGDQLELDGRQAGPLLVELIALVDVVDRFDDLWREEPDLRDPVQVAGSFREVGPFIVDAASFARIDRSASLSARGAIVPSSVGTADLSALRTGARSLERTVGAALGTTDADVDTGLPRLLAETDTALGSTSAVIAVILVQLVGLALYGLGLAASVLAGSRLVETSLLRSRGATARQMAVLACAEALFIVAPAAVAGPVLARAVVGLIERWGPVAVTGLDLDATLSRPAITASVVVAIIAVGVVTWPAVRSAQALAAAQAERTRPAGPNALQRSGADIVIAILALLALWQLTQSSAATRDLTGRLGTDPVLVFAPTLGVIAASLVTLRLIAVFASGVQSTAASGTGLSTALAGWELARRPGRTARTSVLVVMSVTVGTFAVVQGSSWEQSQRDQANAIVSADAVVDPDTRPAASLAPLYRSSAYEQVDGVTDTAPIARPAITITTELGTVSAVAIDVRRADVLRLRSDLRGDDGQLAALRAPPDLLGIPLGEVTGDLTVRYAMAHSGGETGGQIEIAMLVTDRFGTIHRLDTEPVPVDVTEADLRFELTSAALPGYDLRATGPLELVEVEIITPIVLDERGTTSPRRRATFDIVLTEFRIGDTPTDFIEREWVLAPLTLNRNTLTVPEIEVGAVDDGVQFTVDSGRSEQRRARLTARFGTTLVQTQGAAEPPVLPVLVTPALLGELELSVGDTALARVDGTTIGLLLSGTVPVVPFAVDRPVALLIDWPTLVAGRYLVTGRYDQPDEWALTVDERAAADVPRVLVGAPLFSADAVERRSVERQLANDPFAVGLFGSLGLALVASLLIAVVGLLLTAVVGARERRRSYSVLRAMGASTRVLRRWLLLEIVPLVGLSAGAGLAAGILLSRIAKDSLTVTGDGSRAIPQPTVVIPWPAIGLIVGVAVAAGIALPLVTGRLLGRSRTADDLRIGDTT
ncbi:MAG: ABC transporter permease [Ilumatobacter sp.]|nr:ABC transporter permease [Ilumatobacter sp.]